MKNFLLYLSIILTSLILYSCEKETEGISSTIDIELLGGQLMQVAVDEPFVDPGVDAKYKGVDITNSITKIGTVDYNTVGIYTIDYTYINDDGISTTRTRTVIVCDPTITTDISGDYVTVTGTYRKNAAGAIVNYPGFNVKVKKIAPGFFEISDFLGGYYEQRAKYGASYACSGYVQLNSDNTLSLLSSSILPWQDTIDGIGIAKYNPSDGSVSWAADYAGMTFNVVLNKK
jgi:hypothetical protein